MKVTVLIPHFKSKITAYSVSQFLKNVGEHEMELIVINNSYPDESIECLKPFEGQIKIIDHITTQISSHGIALDIGMQHASNDIVITAESDSFPTTDNWLDYYQNLLYEGYEAAASILQLSGGRYGHPAGAMYRKTIWQEAKRYCDKIQYSYFPNMGTRGDGFDYHMMIHSSILEQVLENPNDWFELSKGYEELTKEEMIAKRNYYLPVVAPFHNGMGRNSESIHTYGQRNELTGVPNVLLTDKPKLVYRIGEEPGQNLWYWMLAKQKKIFAIPTEIKWMENRENQQQEYTINAAGFKHIWCGSSFLSMKDTDYNDVYEFKNNQIEELYNSLPKHQKI